MRRAYEFWVAFVPDITLLWGQSIAHSGRVWSLECTSVDTFEHTKRCLRGAYVNESTVMLCKYEWDGTVAEDGVPAPDAYEYVGSVEGVLTHASVTNVMRGMQEVELELTQMASKAASRAVTA